MYQIKQIPEDFIVKEISSITPKKDGKFSYFLLKKKNYTTIRAISAIAYKLNIPEKKIGFAGTKDKNAVTEQMISIPGKDKELTLTDIETKFLGKGDEPISLGDLEGNFFIIIIRNLKKQILKRKRFINYFGEQRFSKNNKDIGKFILKKEFKGAVDLILESQGDYEEKVKEYLEKNKQDYVGALRKIPKKIIKFYIHAYQSYIWNKTAEEFMKDKKTYDIEDIKIPLVGFGTELQDDEIGKIIKNILKEENIQQRDFIIRALPELSSEGDTRDLVIEVKDLMILNSGEDDLNKGRLKMRVTFTLPKAAYATTYIKKLVQDE